MNRLTTYLTLSAFFLASACTDTLPTYEPVVDRPNKHYAADLAECRVLAEAAQKKYAEQQQNEMMAKMFVGALVGAAVGGSYGGDYAGQGAAYGMASGAAATNTEQAYGGPRRVIDRCLMGRGHRVISDLGAG